MEVRVTPASSRHPEDEDVDALVAAPALKVVRMPRGGLAERELPIGPLPTGSWIVAMRPDGFDRWTLSPGVETLVDVEPVEAIEGRIVRAESFAIDRAPLLEVVPAVSTGHQTPDMRLARASATWTLAPTPTGPAPAPTLLTTRLLRDSVRAENLPIGPGSAHVTVFHPHGLPEPEVEIDKDADLVRGRRLRLVAEWAELGGALSTSSAAPFVGARAGPAPWRRIVAVEAARAFVPSLAVGAWIVADCSDATCTTISRERHVLIEAGKTSILE